MFSFNPVTQPVVSREARPLDVTTPAPLYVDPLPPTRLVDQPDRMDHHEKMRIRAAAFRVTRLYPGPVGELVSRELLSFEEFGLRLGKGGSVMRVVDHVLKVPLETSL